MSSEDAISSDLREMLGTLKTEGLKAVRVECALIILRRELEHKGGTPSTRYNMGQQLDLMTLVEAVLREQGHGWYHQIEAHCWDPCRPLQFYLHPHNERRFRTSFFTLDELVAWALGFGPVFRDGEEDIRKPQGLALMAAA